jgi:hypothetical protein
MATGEVRSLKPGVTEKKPASAGLFLERRDLGELLSREN